MPSNIRFSASDQVAFNANTSSIAPEGLRLYSRTFALAERMPRWKGLARLRKLLNPSNGYAVAAPTSAIAVCQGSGAVYTPVVTAGAISSVTVAGGTGYSATVTYTVGGGGGTSGAVTGTVAGGVPVTPLTVSTPGTGYQSPPKISVSSFNTGGTNTITGVVSGTPRVLTYTISNIGTAPVQINRTPTISAPVNLSSATVSQPAMSFTDSGTDLSVASSTVVDAIFPAEAIATAAEASSVRTDTAILTITITATGAGAFSCLVTLPWTGGNFTWTISGTAT